MREIQILSNICDHSIGPCAMRKNRLLQRISAIVPHVLADICAKNQGNKMIQTNGFVCLRVDVRDSSVKSAQIMPNIEGTIALIKKQMSFSDSS